MWWGCFSGSLGPGPGIFWEKDWGTIDAARYQQHILPVIDGWVRLVRLEHGIELQVMQDGAPGHAAASTKAEFASRGITIIQWPPYSLDLNPIETVWNIMKNYILEHFSEKMRYDALQAAVKEAWENVGRPKFDALMASMSARCQAVIAANGMFTKVIHEDDDLGVKHSKRKVATSFAGNSYPRKHLQFGRQVELLLNCNTTSNPEHKSECSSDEPSSAKSWVSDFTEFTPRLSLFIESSLVLFRPFESQLFEFTARFFVFLNPKPTVELF